MLSSSTTLLHGQILYYILTSTRSVKDTGIEGETIVACAGFNTGLVETQTEFEADAPDCQWNDYSINIYVITKLAIRNL